LRPVSARWGAALPYVANDNEVWADTSIPAGSWGLSAYSGGPFSESLEVRPSGDHTAVFYLKVPPRYGGDNWQIAVKKVDPKTNQEVADNVPSLSPVYTAWKRVFVERDRMFRRGGVLYAPDAQHMGIPAGISVLPVFKGPGGAQLDNLEVGDRIALFDKDRPFEGPHDEAYVGAIDRASDPDYALISLVTRRGGSEAYATRFSYTASPSNGATHFPDYSQGSSAAVGVVNSADGQIYDTASNQINGPGSAFYDADLRDVKQPFTDGYVEVLAPREGMGAVPYVPYSIDTAYRFAWLWFSNQNQTAYIHLLGGYDNPVNYGETLRFDNSQTPARPVRTTYVFEGKIEAAALPGSGACFAGNPVSLVNQAVIDHECAHQFDVNSLSSVGHCISDAWTGDGLCQMNQAACPSVTPRRLDADFDSPTSSHHGDVFDVRVCPEGLPHD